MTCPSGKIEHPTRDAALEHIKKLIFRNRLHGEDGRSVGLEPYPCGQCASWHVGHAEQAPLVYHYTVVFHLDAILKDNALRPAPPRGPVLSRKQTRQLPPKERLRLAKIGGFDKEPHPLLWFSRNPDWEYSVIKTEPPVGRVRNELIGRGLLRFAVPAAYAKLRWSDYLALNRTRPAMRNAIAKGGNPAEWLATDEPLPLKVVRRIEVYFGDRGWCSVDDVKDDFDRYLAGRPAVYNAAVVSLNAKIQAGHERILVLKDDAEAAARLAAEISSTFTEAERIVWADRPRTD